MKSHSLTSRVCRLALTLTLLVSLLTLGVMPTPAKMDSSQIDLIGPAGSGRFGTSVTALPGGNIVVTDPTYSVSTVAEVGAVYLFDGSTHALISTLTGSVTNDRVGNGGVMVLRNGNYVVSSPLWNNGAATDAGAVTWCSGAIGCTGAVSPSNSLVGNAANDQVGYGQGGYGGVVALNNGNYVVRSPLWNNGVVTDTGAVTWCSGTTGCIGKVSPGNSLVGSTTADQVGNVRVLTNGNYVVLSPNWNNGASADAGAVTWCSGTADCTGTVSPSNSLVGNTANDHVGYNALGSIIFELSNGNYVVNSPYWDNGMATDAGAVTWCNGMTGCKGSVSPSNSLAGSTASDQIGHYYGITQLSNGNYVVASPFWNNGIAIHAGAVTWCNGTTGCKGSVSPSNSLVGSTTNDWVGEYGIKEQINGNYVVSSPHWDNGVATDAGAITLCSWTIGCTGTVSPSNSLVGSMDNDEVGSYGVTQLLNGNYVVASSAWNTGIATRAGAVTWCSGTTGCTGTVSPSNSLVGNTNFDQVGYGGVIALSNGNYVVSSPTWSNGVVTLAGAVTWCNGTVGCRGAISTTNSLMGSTAVDEVGGVTRLSNGNYVVSSPNWDNGVATDAGAVTWCAGTTGCTGTLSPSNSLVGSTAADYVGSVTVLTNGNYIVTSSQWDDVAATNVGAVTQCSGTTGCTGAVSPSNSLVGNAANDQVGYGQGGYGGVVALNNGNYVVRSPLWNNGVVTGTGAVTWCSGTTGCMGKVSPGNSLVGSTAEDQVGYGVTALSNGNFEVYSPYWDNGAASDAGAVAWCSGTAGCRGAVSTSNSVLGTAAKGGTSLTYVYDSVNDQLVVGHPYDNQVTLFRPLLAPAIAGFAPIGGSAGTTVLITGTMFTGATAVVFNGTSAINFNVLSSTSLTATVPALATTGPISVTAPSGIATSNSSFIVFNHTVALPLIRR